MVSTEVQFRATKSLMGASSKGFLLENFLIPLVQLQRVVPVEFIILLNYIYTIKFYTHTHTHYINSIEKFPNLGL